MGLAPNPRSVASPSRAALPLTTRSVLALAARSARIWRAPGARRLAGGPGPRRRPALWRPFHSPVSSSERTVRFRLDAGSLTRAPTLLRAPFQLHSLP